MTRKCVIKNITCFLCRHLRIHCFTSRMATLETLNFDNLALKILPVDPETKNYVRTVHGACFSRVNPTPLRVPKTVAISIPAMKLLDLSEAELEREDFAEYFAGNKLFPGSEPAAHCYCGHQFGYFSGQLGDGAAVYLGEVLNSKGERWEIQIKGAGLTPFSRTADGRKVLRSSIREFLCSEAMHFLGIPTTRAGVCVSSESMVTRDVYYDGHPKKEKCSVVLRIAPTFLRFGSFEIFKTLDPVTGRGGPSIGRDDILISMLDYTIETFYPEIHEAHLSENVERYTQFFKEVILRTARLVALWQSVGFCHGVLNTDNMSIIGVTLDYGPFGFLDHYDPDHICNASDDGGRYTYIKQPEICLWNLKKLAEAIQRALPLSISLPLLECYYPEYEQCYLNKMREKLGLVCKQLSDDKEIVLSLLNTMECTGADFTNTFRCLSHLVLPGLPDHLSSMDVVRQQILEQCYPLEVLIKYHKSTVSSGHYQVFLEMAKQNPELIGQLGKVGLAIQRILSKLSKAEELEKLTPEGKKKCDIAMWNNWLELYSARLAEEVKENETVANLQELQLQRCNVMNSSNPRFILRNYVAQNAINLAEKGDYSEVQRLLRYLQNPYEEISDLEDISQKSLLNSSCSAEQDDAMPSTSGLETHVCQLKTASNLSPSWAFDLKIT